MQVNTISGKPPIIDRVWFRARYGQNFPELLAEEKNEFLDNCIEAVYTLFVGVADIWCKQPRDIYCNKTQMCYGLLVAWYITDVFPEYAAGVVSSGGIPIKSKTIGGTSITFADSIRAGAQNNADLLAALKSNSFGMKAYLMIQTSGRLRFFLQY